MRLLDAETFELKEFDPSAIPSYAILSHTWEREEVTYEDVAIRFGDDVRRKEGWKKIRLTCKEALDDKIKYAWVDTCCIDKRSSAELSEAINSMFAWYQQATVCYVYLSDVTRLVAPENPLTNARWFTRGYTLQELLAPTVLEFFSVDWVNIGRIQKVGDDFANSSNTLRAEVSHSDRGDISSEIAAITGIELEVLNGQKPLESVCVGRRMAWASSRQTTRPEDMSYCLLGIFNINMPTIYGEGTKAFQRLQEEIVKSSDDHSLFAWTAPDAPPSEPYGLLAPSPKYFANSKDVSAYRDWTDTNAYSVGNLGLAITLPVFTTPLGEHRAFLNCTWTSPVRHRVCLALRRIPGTINQYQRVRVAERDKVENRRGLDVYSRTQIYLRQTQILPSASDVIEKRLCRAHLPMMGPRGNSTRLLSSFLHTDIAIANEDWYRLLLRQRVGAMDQDLLATFHLAGERARLSIVLCIEIIPEHDDKKLAPTAEPYVGSDVSLRELTERRKRMCQTTGRSKRWLKPFKELRQQRSSTDLSLSQKFLILVGTSHNSHQPVCIPCRPPAYFQEFEDILERRANDAALDNFSREYTREKNRCLEMFEDLADQFESMARAHWLHPDRTLRSDLDEVSITRRHEPVGEGLFQFRLEIKKPERHELDSKQLIMELDSTEARPAHDEPVPIDKDKAAETPTAMALEASRASRASAVSAPQTTEASNRDSWVQWTGERPERVLYDNVFELPEDTAAEAASDSEDDFHSPVDEPVDLTTIGAAA